MSARGIFSNPIKYIGITYGQGTITSLAYPAGTQPGDLVIFLANYGAQGIPSGWNSIPFSYLTGASHIAGSETSAIFSAIASSYIVSCLIVFRNSLKATYDAIGAGTYLSGTSISTSSIIDSTPNDTVLSIYKVGNLATAWTSFPVGVTNILNIAGSSSEYGFWIGYEIQAIVGATTPRTIGLTVSEQVYQASISFSGS